jgi:hypothetical protein
MERITVPLKIDVELVEAAERRLMGLHIKPNRSALFRMALATLMAASDDDVRAAQEADAPNQHRGRPKP